MYVFKLGKVFYFKENTNSNGFSFEKIITTDLANATLFSGYDSKQLKEKYGYLIENGFKLVKIMEEEV